MVLDWGQVLNNVKHQCEILKEWEEKALIIKKISEELYEYMKAVVPKKCKIVWDKEENKVTIYKQPKISKEDLAEFGLSDLDLDSPLVKEEKRKAEEEKRKAEEEKRKAEKEKRKAEEKKRKAEKLLALTNYRKDFFNNITWILKGIDKWNITEDEVISKLEKAYYALKALNANNKKVWRWNMKYEDVLWGIEVIGKLYDKNEKIKELLKKIKNELKEMKEKPEIEIS